MAESVYRIREDRPFTKIDKEIILDRRLSTEALGLAVRMLSFRPGQEYTLKYVMKASGFGRDKVKRLFSELSECGYLTIQHTREEGRFGKNVYELSDVKASPITENPLTENQTDAQAPITENPSTEIQSTRLRNTRDKYIPPIIPPKQADVSMPAWKPERFAAFWDYYRTNGRSEARKRAVKAWDKLKPDDDLLVTIGRALQRQVASKMWQAGVGIPYASTYLNGRYWEDAPDDADRPRGRPPERQEEAFGEWH